MYQSAATAEDDGSLGGTSGNGITASAGNIQNMFTTAQMNLQLQNVVYNPNKQYTGKVKLDKLETYPVAIISPQVNNFLLQYLGAKTSKMGDEVSVKGYQGMFMGFNIFVSNNLGWSANMILSTNPTAEDTITINAVTFEFVAAPGDAGEVVIGSTATTTTTNLKNALNALGTTIANGADAGYFAITTANQNLLKNLTATSSGTTLSIIMTGYGSVVVSQSMTAAVNVWTAAKQVQHCLFTVSNSIDLVIQKNPTLFINPVSGKVGRDFATWSAYGKHLLAVLKSFLISLFPNPQFSMAL